MLKKIFILLFIFQVGVSFAQTKTTLSLQEAIDIATKDNWEILKSQADVSVAEASYKETNSLFLPKIQLSETLINTTDPLQSFGLKLKQETVTQQDFNPELLNDPSSITNFNSRLEIQQPLINFDGIWGRKAAQDQLAATKLKSQRTKSYVAFLVKQTYFGLQLASEQTAVVAKAVETAKAHFKMAKDNLKAGYVKDADVLAAEISVLELENQLVDAANNIETANEQLSLLLGESTVTKFQLSEKLHFDETEIQTNTGIDNIENRSDMLAYKYGISARAKMIKMERNKFLPNLNAFGSYELNDKNAFGSGANNYLIGAKLNWTIFNGYKRIASTQKAKAELNKSQLEYNQYVATNKIEIRKAARNIKLARQKLHTTKVAVKQAKENLRIRNDRYEHGLEKTADLLAAQTSLAQKELGYLNTLYNYKIAVFQMQFLTSN